MNRTDRVGSHLNWHGWLRLELRRLFEGAAQAASRYPSNSLELCYIGLMSEIARIATPERSRVRRSLGVLGVRYPNGLDWLERRLDDIECGRAQLWQVGHGRVAFGWAIVTPKGPHEAKLSTLYVAPAARGSGWGRKLIDAISAELRHRDILTLRVTVDENDTATRSFFEMVGFKALPDGRRPYGERFDCAYLLNLDSLNSLPVSPN